MGQAIVVEGSNAAALFTLKVRRGEGMALLSMNWKQGAPPEAFVGFAIEFRAPGDADFTALNNDLTFLPADGNVVPAKTSSRLAPFQRFRWVHFPHDANLDEDFHYRVTPVTMDASDTLSYGEPQEASVLLGGDTYPGELNVAFTRGFVSSQAFVERYEPIETLLPANADRGLDFKPTNPKAAEALPWMGFEAREAILGVLDRAIADPAAQVKAVAYDLNEPEIVTRLEQLGGRLRMIIDDSGSHGGTARRRTWQQNVWHRAPAPGTSSVSTWASCSTTRRSSWTAHRTARRVRLDELQLARLVCPVEQRSCHSWSPGSSGILRSLRAILETRRSRGFRCHPLRIMSSLGVPGMDAEVAFSPHSTKNALLTKIAEDIGEHTESSLLYSLAFLYQTPGAILDAVKKLTADDASSSTGYPTGRSVGSTFYRPTETWRPSTPQSSRGTCRSPSNRSRAAVAVCACTTSSWSSTSTSRRRVSTWAPTTSPPPRI